MKPAVLLCLAAAALSAAGLKNISRDALHDKGAQPDQIKALMDKVEKSFGKFNEVEQKLWTEVKE